MPGRMRMYTSGWPKIQNRFWYSNGSPPAAALKKFVPKLRSRYTIDQRGGDAAASRTA